MEETYANLNSRDDCRCRKRDCLPSNSTKAERTLTEVLSMAPQHAFAHAILGLVQIVTNRAAQGIAECERALALDRNFEANRNHPLSHFQLAATLALLGQLNEARAATQAGLALDPGFTLRRLHINRSSDNPTYLASSKRMYKGMRMAGVPEG